MNAWSTWSKAGRDSENFGKVAQGNKSSCTGPPTNEVDPDYKNSCRTCGCPVDQMPMVFRGTGWCCELHRKEQQGRRNE